MYIFDTKTDDIKTWEREIAEMLVAICLLNIIEILKASENFI